MRLKFTCKKKIESVFILGSTSLIAKALCHQLAINGCRRFTLVCRNINKNKLMYEELINFFNLDIEMHYCDLFIENTEDQINKVCN